MSDFFFDLSSSIVESEKILGVQYTEDEKYLIKEASLCCLGTYMYLYLVNKTYVFKEENTQKITKTFLCNIDEGSQLVTFFVFKSILEGTNVDFKMDLSLLKKSCIKYEGSGKPLSEIDFLCKINSPVSIIVKKQMQFFKIKKTDNASLYLESLLNHSFFLSDFNRYMVCDGVKNKIAMAAWDKLIERKNIVFLSSENDFQKRRDFYSTLDFGKTVLKDSIEGRFYMSSSDAQAELLKNPAFIIFVLVVCFLIYAY